MEDLNIKMTETVKLLQEVLYGWYESFIKLLPNLFVALLVIIVFAFLAKGVRGLLEKLVGRLSDNKAVTRLLGSIGYLSVLFAGLFIVLGILDLEKTVTSLLAGAGVIGLVLGFAFQELSANFISGIFIAFRKPFRVGDVIQSGSHLGEVQRIAMRATVIRTFQGQDIYIPNKILLTEPVINYTNDPRRLLELQVGISYGDDLQKVEDLVLKALKKFEGCAYPEETKVYFREFGDSSINFVVRYWIDYPGDQNFYRATHYAVKAIKKAFDENGITIPFPIRTLDIPDGAISLHSEK